jgi:hypothetical protein
VTTTANNDPQHPTAAQDTTPDGFQLQQRRRRSTSPPQSRSLSPSLSSAASTASGKDEQRPTTATRNSDSARQQLSTAPLATSNHYAIFTRPATAGKAVSQAATSSSSSSSGNSSTAPQLTAATSSPPATELTGDDSDVIVCDSDGDDDTDLDDAKDVTDDDDVDMSAATSSLPAGRGKRSKEIATPAVPVVTAATIKGGKKQKLRHSTNRKDWERTPTAALIPQQAAAQRGPQEQHSRSTVAPSVAVAQPQQSPLPSSLPSSSQPAASPPPSSPSAVHAQPASHPATNEHSGDVVMSDTAPATTQTQLERSLGRARKQRDRIDKQIAALQQQQQQQQQQHQQQQQQQRQLQQHPPAVAAPGTATAARAAAPAYPAPASALSAVAPSSSSHGGPANQARKQRVVHSPGDIERHGLSAPTTTDLVLAIDTPADGRCDPLHRTKWPNKKNSNDQARTSVVELLSTALAIPAPRLSKLLSYSNVQTFRDLDALTGSAAAAQHLPPAEREYFAAAAAGRSSDDEGDERGYLRSGNLPTASCHMRWTDLLTPASCVMSATKSRSSNGHRIVLRLAFNNEVVCSVVRLHLVDYIDLFEGRDTPALGAQAIAAWKASTSRSGAGKASVTISGYTTRYETTAVTGWPLGPDGPPSSELFMDFTQPLGNVDALRNFIAVRAPHCTRWHVQDRPAYATVTVQFYHERQYRTELFALDGMTSPLHGIFRPLRLHYKQREPPAAQCCSCCGEPGHSAKACPLAPSLRSAPGPGVSAMDTSSLASGGPGVCRLCYSSAPQHACLTPPEQRHCKLCNKQGHTSFSCPQYRSRWVPLDKPPESRPVNPRPLYLVASQRGVPWSSVVAGRPPPAQQPTPAPALPLHSTAHFPPLSSAPAAPPSQAPSTASPLASPAPSPPPSPTSPAAAVDQQALIANVIAAVLAQLTPHLTSLASAMAKLAARTDELCAELHEERTARQKHHSFPLPLPSAHWFPAAPDPINVHMADAQPATQPAAQPDPQRGPAPQPRGPPAVLPATHQSCQLQFAPQGAAVINNAPPPTLDPATLSSLAALLPPHALQPAGLTSAQQPAPPPHYQQ